MRILLLAALVFTAAHAKKTLDRVVAVVQGKAILLSDVQSLHSQVESSELLRGFYKIDGGITDQNILNRLVEDQIIRARLKELGTEVTGDSVNREIEEIARKNRFGVPQLKAVLKNRASISRIIFRHSKVRSSAVLFIIAKFPRAAHSVMKSSNRPTKTKRLWSTVSRLS